MRYVPYVNPNYVTVRMCHRLSLTVSCLLSQHEVYCVGYTAAHYIKHVLKLEKKVYLIGLPGLANELEQQGIRHIGVGPDPLVGGPADWAKIKLDPEVHYHFLSCDHIILF